MPDYFHRVSSNQNAFAGSMVALAKMTEVNPRLVWNPAGTGDLQLGIESKVLSLFRISKSQFFAGNFLLAHQFTLGQARLFNDRNLQAHGILQ
jgi:ABC-type phosphonate transport system ATPase subunit